MSSDELKLSHKCNIQYENYIYIVARFAKILIKLKNLKMKIHLLNFLVFLFFIVYNKVVVISSKDSHIVHDYINRRKL